jgi:hypothetical protein
MAPGGPCYLYYPNYPQFSLKTLFCPAKFIAVLLYYYKTLEAISCELNSTNPYPVGTPVTLSLIIFTETTPPFFILK